MNRREEAPRVQLHHLETLIVVHRPGLHRSLLLCGAAPYPWNRRGPAVSVNRILLTTCFVHMVWRRDGRVCGDPARARYQQDHTGMDGEVGRLVLTTITRTSSILCSYN